MTKKQDYAIPATRNIRLMVVDDHPIVRDALEELFNNEAYIVIRAKADNTSEALKAIKKTAYFQSWLETDVAMEGCKMHSFGWQLNKYSRL
jgi:CheY-like chemotaxis protein